MTAATGAQSADPQTAKCVFLDRDGTLIHHVPYLGDPREVRLLPSVVEGIALLKNAGCLLFLHTNQSGIGRGYFSAEQAVACNDAMLQQIGLGTGLFEEIRICPESPDQPSVYRKPSPRYAQEMMARYAVPRTQLCYIGDNITDMQTAVNVGCAAVGVDTGGHDLRTLLSRHNLARLTVYDTFLEAASHAVELFGRSHASR